MKTTKTKKPNMFWLKDNKKISCTILAITNLLLGFNYSLKAQSNTAYGADAFKLWFSSPASCGVQNSAFGYAALRDNGVGGANTAVGGESMPTNTSGSYNTAVGYWALYSNKTSSASTAVGHAALISSTGAGNTAFGVKALSANTTGINNTGLGYEADVALGNLTNATAIGYSAKVNASNTIQLGNSAVTEVYAGVGNKATLVAGNLQALGGKISTKTGVALTLEVNNQKAGLIDHTLFNTSYGYQSLYSNTTGSENTASGSNALYSNTTGDGNTASGSNALYANTTGFDNTASGFFALRRNTKGSGNTASGSSALVSNTEGSNNTASGTSALYNNVTGPNNVANGYHALYSNTTGGYNTASGYQALDANTTGDGNTAIGDRSLLANTTGNYNTAVGSLTLNSNIDGKYNTAIGYTADVQKGFNNSTAIGNNTIVNASDKIRLGDAGVKVIEGTVMYTVSDGRFKTNINEEEVKGLAFIQKLRPVVYNFDTKKFQAFLTQNMPADARQKHMDKDFSTSTAIRQSGFIAQEVEKAAQEIGYDFNGLHKPESANDNYSLAYSQFVVPLVKGMQEQQTQIEKQEQKIEQQEKKIEAQQKINEQLQQQLQQQQQQIDGLRKMIADNGNSMITKDDLAKPTTGNEIQVYPNPNGGTFNVVVPAGSQKIELVDMKGALVKTINVDGKTSSYQLNFSGYAKGVYILNVWINGKTQTSKVVIQ